jgi:anti-sigma regulatory factor (Ser/Thr protein kinase)
MHPLPSRSPERASRLDTASLFQPVELRLPARASELRRARECVAAAGAEFGLDPKACYEFVFAVNEAVTNAVKHGTPYADGHVAMSLVADGDALVCTVSDRGPFVHRATPPDPATGESGRGFVFMSAMTDDFELVIEPGATIVRLRKIRPTGALVASA